VITITHAELAASCLNTTEFPDWDLPEIVMVGRSNVGKSSLINMLLGRKNLARTSNTPGKTRRIHFYRVESSWGPFVLVDLPGYGYAKVSKSEQAAWQRKLEAFMKTRQQIRLSLQLIDSRHAPQDNDLAMASWLAHHQHVTRVILTKADKLKQSDMAKAPSLVASALRLDTSAVLVTSEQGRGRDALWALLKPFITGHQ
jgi:GTP-binding protein